MTNPHGQIRMGTRATYGVPMTQMSRVNRRIGRFTISSMMRCVVRQTYEQRTSFRYASMITHMRYLLLALVVTACSPGGTTVGDGGASGSAGNAGTSGSSGSSGTAGTNGAGAAGASGSAGTGATGGTSGTAGVSGSAGAAGTAAAGGSAGSAGSGGTSGTAGAPNECAGKTPQSTSLLCQPSAAKSARCDHCNWPQYGFDCWGGVAPPSISCVLIDNKGTACCPVDACQLSAAPADCGGTGSEYVCRSGTMPTAQGCAFAGTAQTGNDLYCCP